MRHPYLQLMQDESTDLADFLAGLSEADWSHPTLCEGWRVREVVSHMAAGHTASLPSYLIDLLKSGGNTDRVSVVLARRYAAQHPTSFILSEFRRGTTGKPKGPTALVPIKELFVDHLVHHQDIRRPLGRPRQIDEARLKAAMDALPKLSGRVGSAERMRPLRVVTDDLSWSHGDGPLLQGPAEAVIMALCGRGPAADDLRGEGAELLRTRLRNEAHARATPVAGTTSGGVL